MEIVNVSIDQLNEAEYNPRKLTDKQKEDIKKSIEEFGFVNPLVVNSHYGRENILVGGHQRLKVAKELGYEEVPVVFVDLDKDKEKELNVRLNKNTGEWDLDVLSKEFTKLELKDWGFDDEETSVVFLNQTKTLSSGSANQQFEQEEVDLKFEEDLLKEMVVIVFYSQERFKKYKELRTKYQGQEADLIYEAVTKYYER
jgi:ParB-like chromosome segregation protein Spo0J